ncbi:hypothetical protein [Chromobacterium sp. IIBBL 290-4]|uniref:hypothetical protein n=1 Tax=Chromobacterium sp. IIBBL 290-4 TaxID=2953890 RepID=UPI0020B67AD7|nr:hypothetical protein [Chromobacterium sp. IIBBL 290-4]UTH72227.1 hypothetical protein NKT35_11735 [Chromobacterium sp. IIBBL 290-4]
MPIFPKHGARCHCGDVILERALPNWVESSRRYDRSVCKRKGEIGFSIPLSGLRIVQGAAWLTRYQLFNIRTAKHCFGKVCGIYTHHQHRFDPNVYA